MGTVLARILVVDGDPDVRTFLEQHIKNADYECLLAKNAQEALDIVEKQEPGIVILDQEIAGIGGLETCRRIRNSGHQSTIYIILLCTGGDVIEKLDGNEIGPDFCLVKPVVPNQLMTQIKTGIRALEDRNSAMTDRLTGLYNRRSFNTFLDREKAENDRYGKGFSLVFLDLDHFKRINDEYGRDVGDAVLHEVADLIRGTARPSDLSCRWGGEEFAWLMPKTDLESAKKAADRLRTSISQHHFDQVGTVTVSLGIALGRRDEELTELIKRTDDALYAAKGSGRNRVVTEGQDVSEAVSLNGDVTVVGKSESLRMLIVDDDPLICQFVCVLGEAQGFETDYIVDPNNFGGTFRPDIDLIILDLNMPGVDGVELLRFLSENGFKGAVVLISAVDQDILSAAEGMALAYRLQVLGSCQKPLDPEQVNSMLDQAINLSRSHKGNLSALDLLAPGGSDELPTLDDLRGAIANRELDVYFHPQICLEGRTVSGLEALARWKHPTKGFIPPDYFIAFAEKYNLINDLTALVVEKVCEYCKNWQDRWEPVPISVNISESNLDNLNFPEEMVKTVQSYGVSPSTIMIEVTETSLATDPNHVLNVLTRLRLKGFQLSIDDFGTGHSSLARLRKIPFRELKIDKMFIDACDSDRESGFIVSNTMNLAHGLGLKVVAEGVENEAQLAVLEDLKCDHVQGYYFSKPLPASEFEEWYEKKLAEEE